MSHVEIFPFDRLYYFGVKYWEKTTIPTLMDKHVSGHGSWDVYVQEGTSVRFSKKVLWIVLISESEERFANHWQNNLERFWKCFWYKNVMLHQLHNVIYICFQIPTWKMRTIEFFHNYFQFFSFSRYKMSCSNRHFLLLRRREVILTNDSTKTSYEVKLTMYGGYHEIEPQNACEIGFCHVTTFAFFFEMPQNRTHSFFLLFPY